jgi:serine/threonine protein kinase
VPERSPTPTTRPGDAFTGSARFQLIRRLGEGGMGVVYEAFDRERHTRVALKTVQTLTADSLVRFKNEFRALQDLQHPNLVRLDELVEEAGTWFFTMELIDGVTFFEWVRPEDTSLGRMLRTPRSDEPPSPRPVDPEGATVDTAPAHSATEVSHTGPATLRLPPAVRQSLALLDETRLRAALRQLVLGLDALHEAHKVHRDIKPGNVLVTREGRVVVLDFGLVTEAFRGREGRAVGTGAFMAPEQGRGEAVGPAADWYSVGVVLYLALTGRPPFVGSFDQVVELKRAIDPPPPIALVPDVPFDLNLLCTELLFRDPADRPDAREILARLDGVAPGTLAPAPARDAVFVGRGAELAALAEAVAARPAILLVHGESGVGKSALVKHFLAGLARAPRALVLSGRCYERESVPYKAVDQVIDALARELAGWPDPEVLAILPEDIELCAGVFPALTQVGAIARALEQTRGVARPDDPLERRRRVFAALRALLARLAGRGPLVLAIDDLQWSDGDSLALLAELMAPPGPPPLLLCATVRTSADAEALSLAALEQQLGGLVRTLPVLPLAADAARQMALRLLATVGERGAPAARAGAGTTTELAAELAAEAGGHPLFLDALTRHRLLHPRGEGPVRLDDALYARAQGLEPPARDLLDVVCVAGTPVQQEACAAAAGLPFADFVHHVSALRAAHLVQTHGIHRGDSVEPYHDRVREAVLAHVPEARRRGLHAALARALEAAGTGDDDALATHFRAAGEPVKAAHHAARAAERARAALAFERAAHHYRTALELDPGPPAHAHALRVRLAEALGNAGRGREAALAYLAAARDGEADDTVELRRRAAEQFLRGGHPAEGLATYDEVLATIGLHVPRGPGGLLRAFVWERARLWLRGYGYTLRGADAPGAAETRTLRRLDILRSMHSLGMSHLFASQAFLARHLREALALGEPARLADALATEAIYVSAPGGRAAGQAARLLTEARALAARVDDPYVSAMCDGCAGISDYLLGRWRAALALVDRAEALWRERAAGAFWERDTMKLYGVRTLAFLGDLDELARRLAAARKNARERGDLYLQTNLRIGFPVALACVARDDAAAALREGQEAMAEWRHEGTLIEDFHDFQGQATAELYAGDTDAAERRVAATWPRLRAALFLRIQVGRAVSTHLRARIALAAAAAAAPGSAGRTERLRRVRADARRLDAEDMPWIDPLAALLRAGRARLRGDDDGALFALTRAERDASAASMRLHAAAARRMRGVLLGGDEGRGLRDDADAIMAGVGVRCPDRFAALLVPGVAPVAL